MYARYTIRFGIHSSSVILEIFSADSEESSQSRCQYRRNNAPLLLNFHSAKAGTTRGSIGIAKDGIREIFIARAPEAVMERAIAIN